MQVPVLSFSLDSTVCHHPDAHQCFQTQVALALNYHHALPRVVKGAHLLCSGTGGQYLFRFRSQQGYSIIRMPFNAFRPISPGEPPLDANTQNLTGIALRFELEGR